MQNDTLPPGPYRKARRWVAPFARTSREDDYHIAWAFFEEQTAVPKTAIHSLQG